MWSYPKLPYPVFYINKLSLPSNYFSSLMLVSQSKYVKCVWRIRFVQSTDINHTKYPFLICLAVFFSWAFTVLICFRTILFCSLRGWPHTSRSETFRNFKRMVLPEILSPRVIAYIAIFIMSILVSENFRHDFKPRNNEGIRRKNVREISEIMLLFQTICVYQWFHRVRLYFLNSTENR